MKPLGIFISSVQREFAEERAALRDYLRGDPLMRRFFAPFLFEDVPATDRRPDALYLDEVERCELYVGLFGDEYGTEDEEGISPTEREFDHATALGKQRLIFLKAVDGASRHPKMQALIGKAQAGLIRARFGGTEDLVAALYASLVEYLGAQELLRWEPFDAAACPNAGFDDLDPERMMRFVGTAGRARQFPLSEDASPGALLEHLNLLNKGRPTNAAILLFGRAPQRFLISSQIKCAHFHGTQVAKPIPSHQVYTGTVFELVDHAVDFVLSKIALSVGTRAESIQAPVAYEIPKEVITEAIVNAVAHRDYTSGGSVQVMLFADRLEVWNPGGLPPPLTLDKLRVPHESIPGNPLLARAMYLVKYIEQMGTGTLDMIERCGNAGLLEPEFEAAGEFVIRIRRAALAGQPVVFTDRADVERNSNATTQETRGTTQENTQETRGTTQETRSTRERILALLSTEPEITRRRLAERVGITADGVKYHLTKLRAAGVIQHVGATKAGRWEVLK
jgi:predicted HTH transcriptional regulator